MRKLQMPSVPCGRGGRMKVVHRKDAKALKGDKSLSYQLITPDNAGSRKFLITVVDIRPGGSTPVHEHRTVESMYYIVEGRGEVTSGRERKVLGPDTAIYFPAGSTHGIRNVGRGRLRYLSCHAPPYEIEDLYRSWQAPEGLVTTGG
ncbi:MAG: cupin domain-containing protein [Methanobacteriota archaeon]|nr:MAG: cupin domain-containing protein [Euryarchaeota archaeon]